MSTQAGKVSQPGNNKGTALAKTPLPPVLGLLLVPVFYFLYSKYFDIMAGVWDREDSYYSHGPLVPLISLALAGYILWNKRNEPVRPSFWGLPLAGIGCFLLIASDFLGFNVFAQVSFIPLLAGVIATLLGFRFLAALWFPLLFLLFMIPIPPSVTQSVQLKIKLFATEGAVQIGRLIGLPLVQDGSFVHFGSDQLLVGDVCSGLRSLVALLALGAIVAYMSKSSPLLRGLIFVIAAPIAVFTNVLRIFTLCVIGYFYGSEAASGTVHDVSGYLIFVVAFVLLMGVERLAVRLSRTEEDGEPDS